MASLQPHSILSDQCQLIEELFLLTAILNQCGLAVFGSGQNSGINVLPPKSYIENGNAKTIQAYLNKNGARMDENLLDFHDNWSDNNHHLTFRSGVNSQIFAKIAQNDIKVLAGGLVGDGKAQVGQFQLVKQQTHLYQNNDARSAGQICDLVTEMNKPGKSYNALIPNQKNFALLRTAAEKNCARNTYENKIAAVKSEFKAIQKCKAINDACYKRKKFFFL